MPITFEQLYRAVRRKLEEIFGPGLPHLDEIAYHFARILAHNLGIIGLAPEEYAEHLKALRRLLADALAEWEPLKEAFAEALSELGPAPPQDAKRLYELLLKKTFYELGWLELTSEELRALLAELSELWAKVHEHATGATATAWAGGTIALRCRGPAEAPFEPHRHIVYLRPLWHARVEKHVYGPGSYLDIAVVG